jgi:hypothetical protein
MNQRTHRSESPLPERQIRESFISFGQNESDQTKKDSRRDDATTTQLELTPLNGKMITARFDEQSALKIRKVQGPDCQYPALHPPCATLSVPSV